MARSKIIGAVEIGTSKVVVLIGEVVGPRSLNIIGKGQSTSQGVRKGEIMDLRTASDCAHAAIHAAERNAGASIEGVYLSQTGGHLVGFANRGSVQVSSAQNEVGEDDIDRAIGNAKSKDLARDRIYVHHVQGSFLLDGKEVDDPLGMTGENLESNYWHVHGDEDKIADQIHVVNGFGLKVDDLIVSSIASGSMVATDTEKDHGVLVIDIGCGTTDYALYRRKRIVRTGVIPVGGDHLTNDLALGLRVSYKHAESIKHRFGKAIIDKTDKNDSVLLIGDLTIGDRPIPRLAIYKILSARIEEILSIIANRLGSVISPQNLPGGVVLTGGSSRLPMMCEAVRATLGVDARLGDNPRWVNDGELKQPEYSTVLGLLYYGLTAQRTEETRAPARKGGLLRKVTGIFAAN